MDEIEKARVEKQWRDIKHGKVAKAQRELDLLKARNADESAISEESRKVRELKARLDSMSPPGGLGLPKLLDERRIEYNIPDSAFNWAAVFDRVLGYQLDVFDGHKINDKSEIYIPQYVMERNRKLTPKVLILNAGLKARDEMKSHGIEVGDVCMLCRMAIFSAVYDFVDNIPQVFLQLRSGDLSAGKDTARRVRSGELRVEYRQFMKGTPQEFWAHVYVDREGVVQGNPEMPYIGEDQ